jgi:hypothetical protein
MPTERERQYYAQGYGDGYRDGVQRQDRLESGLSVRYGGTIPRDIVKGTTKKRKLSAWNKFVKANSKKPRFRYRNGKLNLKKMAVAFRKTPAGRKKRR